MAKGMKCRLGKVELLANNPRTIRDNSFNRLAESLERDSEFMDVRGIVVWEVPESLEGESSPFKGQEGKLVVIGGNQRCRALMAMGKTELKDEWVLEAKDAEGNWWHPDRAARFILIDNNPDGIAGSNDYEKMIGNFDELTMRMSGIDFSEFQALLGKTPDGPVNEETGDTAEDVVEKGEHGEKSDELKDFIAEREKTRRDLKEIDEFGFYLVLVFNTLEEKIEFVAKTGLTGKKGVTSVDMGTYIVAVFESYQQKMAFCEQAGLTGDGGDDEGSLLFDMFCDGREFAKKIGIELAETGMHFRDQIVDTQLEGMALPAQKQKSEKEIAEEIYRNLKNERKGLGMSTRSTGERKPKGEKEGKKELSYEDVADGELLPSWVEEAEKDDPQQFRELYNAADDTAAEDGETIYPSEDS